MKCIHANLKEIARVFLGYPARESVDSLASGDVAVVQMRNVDLASAEIDWDSVIKVDLPFKKEPEWLQSSDIIISTRGTSYVATLVKSALCKAICGPSMYVIRVNQSVILPGFLAWLLNQKSTQIYFQNNATGSYILNLRREVVENTPLAIPSINIQQLIISLNQDVIQERMTMQKLIENRQKQIEAIASELLSVPKLPREKQLNA